MVDLARSASTEWAVASRLGPAFEQAADLIASPLPRPPRLLVPVDVQALVVTASGGAGAARGDIRSRMLDAAPDTRLPPPFEAAPDLPAGVHLHWAVPDGLTAARPAPPGAEASDLNLRPLPDRWLVCRLGPAGAGKVRSTRSWIVESDRASSVPLESWDPAAPPATGDRPLEPGTFTAATGGDLGWAGVYDNVRDRLAFHDDLADLRGAAATLAYVVVGWYADAALDPLHLPTDPSSFTALLAELGWDVDLSSLPEIEDRFEVFDQHLATIARSAGLPDRGTGRPIARDADHRSEVGGRVAAERETSVVLGIDDFVLDPTVRFVTSRRQPRVTATLYHGTIFGVDVGGGGVDQRPSAGAVSLTLGSTGVDVISRVLAGTDAVQERLVNAFSYGTLRDHHAADGIVAHDEAVHRHGFTSIPDPTPGIVERVRDPVIEPPLPPAIGGSKFDGLLDLGAVRDATLQIAFTQDRSGAFDATLVELERAGDLSFSRAPAGPVGGGRPAGARSAPSAAPAPVTFSDVVRPNPRWYQPAEPVLAVRGANRSQRHGYDGRFDPGEQLGCRLSGQPVRGYADLIVGRQVVAPPTHDALPPECADLVREAALTDPNAISHLVSMVPTSAGWTNTQVSNRLSAEMVLSVHLQVREADVGELLDASLKEGVEPSPVGVTYWRQPWVPIYAEWELALATTDRAGDWRLGEVDLDPVDEPAVATRALLGRSLLNSSGARAFAAGVDELLDEEAVADAAGRGILTDAQADDLARLAIEAARADLLVTSLTGVNDHYLGFDTDAAFAQPDDDDPVVSPERLPELLRAGWLRIDRLRLVDAFGRTLDLGPRLAGLGLADALEVQGPITGPVAAGSAPPAHLPPRFTTPARLRMRLIDANDDGAEARVDESTAIQARNPVAGWLLPDHADDALEFFDATGAPLGQLFHRGLRSAVTWEGAPGRPGPLGAGPAGDLGGSVHLARMAVAVVQRDAVERAESAPPDESPLGALLRAIDTTLWSTDPIGAAGTSPVSVLVGRPVAVVRLRMGLELYDDTDDYALSSADAAARRAVLAAMVERAITVRLGALGRFDDGVLGYYLDDDYSVFHPVHAAVRELARHGGPQDGFLDEVTVARQYGDDLTAKPILAPYVQGEPDLTLRPGRDVDLTVLVLAGLGINATSGVVPRKGLALNRSWTDAALQRIVPSFRVGPVLVDPVEIRMPRISALPDDPEGRLRNTWTRRDTPTTWRDDPILAATMAARLAERPAVAHEGWARLLATEE